MPIRIVTAYTPEYQQYALKLAASAGKFNVPISPIAFETRGSWQHNIMFKPTAVLQEFDNGYDILWLDSDIELTADPAPTIDALGLDTACMHAGDPHCPDLTDPRLYNFETGQIDMLNQPFGGVGCYHTIWGQCLYFKNLPRVRALIETWKDYSDRFTGRVSDEQTLMKAVALHPDVSHGSLNLFEFTNHTLIGKQHGKPGGWL
jgi:hypothetical protein